MTEDRKQHIYPLSEFVMKMAKKSELEEYKNNTVYGFQMVTAAIGKFLPEEKQAQIDDKLKFENVQKSSSIMLDLKSKFQHRVKSLLRSTRWEAYGYFMPRKPTDEKVLIPLDLWDSNSGIKWDDNKIKGNGLEFIQVEIRQAVEKEETIKDEEVKEVVADIRKPKKAGRPNKQKFITEAYESFKAKNKGAKFKTKSEIYYHVYKEAKILFPDQPSLKDSTIKLALMKKVDEDNLLI